VITETRNDAYLASLKSEESKHYNRNCQLYQCSCLLCTSYGEHKAVRSCEDLKPGTPPVYFILLREQLCQEKHSCTQYNMLLHV